MGSSSSAPTSVPETFPDSQSQRAPPPTLLPHMPHFAPTAPSGAPDAPHGAPRLYLKLMVPPKAQYARYIVKVLLSQPR